MPTPVGLSTLLTRVRRRCKMEASSFVSDEELGDLIKSSAAGLYDRLIEARGQEYYRTTAQLLTMPGRAIYELPADFYQLLGVFQTLGSRVTWVSAHIGPSDPTPPPVGECFPVPTSYDDPRGEWTALDPFMVRDLEHGLSASYCGPTRYRLRGRQDTSTTTGAALLELRPAPTATTTIRIEYVPACNVEPLDVEGAEPVWDGIQGWEEWIVLDVSIQVLGMEESSTGHLQQALARMEERIAALAPHRDAGAPEQIVDVRRSRRRHRL